MNKKVVFSFLVILVLCSLGVGSICYFASSHEKSDGLKFKEEYESLNGTIRESDGAKYNDVFVSSDNPIVYVDSKKALEVLKNENAILYVGANWCPWCRNAVPVLFETAKNLGVDRIYYLDLDQEKSNYKVQNGELVQTTKGSEGYYELLQFLNDELQDYVLKDENGNEYSTGEKRIYMPFVVASRKGTVTKTHVGTVSLDEGQTKYSSMTEKQKKELYQVYETLMQSILDDKTCSGDGMCH